MGASSSDFTDFTLVESATSAGRDLDGVICGPATAAVSERAAIVEGKVVRTVDAGASVRICGNGAVVAVAGDSVACGLGVGVAVGVAVAGVDGFLGTEPASTSVSAAGSGLAFGASALLAGAAMAKSDSAGDPSMATTTGRCDSEVRGAAASAVLRTRPRLILVTSTVTTWS
jgi:hypothetical protein